MKIRYTYKDKTIRVGDWVTYRDRGWKMRGGITPCYRVSGCLGREIIITVNGEDYDVKFPLESLVKVEEGQKDYRYEE